MRLDCLPSRDYNYHYEIGSSINKNIHTVDNDGKYCLRGLKRGFEAVEGFFRALGAFFVKIIIF